MKEELEKLLAAGKIGRAHVEPLLQLVQGGFCMHRSWGFGKITTVDTVFSRLIVDFPSKPGHSMDLAFAAESLKPIPGEHILARKASDLAGLRQMAGRQHLDLIRVVLQSYGGRATLDQIQHVLVPDVITDDWKKWWETARRELKKDGHFVVPIKKTEPVVYQEAQVPIQERLMAEFKAAKGLKARLAVTQELIKNLEDLDNSAAAAAEAVAALNPEINSHLRTQPALALEALFTRDDLRTAARIPPQPGEATVADFWAQGPRLAHVLEPMPAAKHRHALQSFKEANPDRWHELLLALLNTVSAKLCSECVHLLIQEGKIESLKDTLARLVSQHAASSELLLWLAKERSDAFADILGPEVFRSMLSAMERDQFLEKKSNRLHDFILADQELLVELIGTADLEVIKDLTRALQLSPAFDDMDKRSLLARIVKSYPAIQALISGEQSRQDTSFYVSWESLERRKREYDELVNKKLPANSREIAIARSYGDLRENHEYKAAKEMHKILMRRKSELESEMIRARGSDFSSARTDAVTLGTRVTVTELGTQHTEPLCILGAWDSEPEKGIISYLTPIAQSLLNRKVGEEVEFELHGAKRLFRIDAIEVWRAPTAPAPEVPAPALSAAPPPVPEATPEWPSAPAPPQP
jgi:transcription elongation GreA/GreB family factor